ncbi:MAG TPA: methyltransferase domain-containing protein [Pyrinomonadaceae bacterium]|jgi:SAM-dependent methyltransferase/uncharacterized protein YbaR (Trm112 family)|nr:methyltransferase domain-containing protein [Pyrinomonadaceae bacterium]
MRHELLQYLACPECGGPFSLSVFSNTPEHIDDGLLACSQCTAWYVIRAGVPRMLSDDLLPENKEFYGNYTKELIDVLGERFTKKVSAGSFAKLQKKTVRNFGSEWETWDDFGWQGGAASNDAKRIFNYKVLFTPHELRGKLLLDAGCGNGRYTVVAREYGAEVIGVDLSAADTAYKNTRNDPKIHIIQGDLFKLPLRKNLLDFVFSNGVLMHTGDAHKAFLSIASHLNENGVITVHLYHRGNIIYEFNDWWLRAIGTRLPLHVMYRIANGGAAVVRLFPQKLLLNVVNAVVRLEAHPHYIFDWYTAPIATHHTYKEVYRWLKDAGLHLVEDHNATHHRFLRMLVPFWFLTVKAQKQPLQGLVRHTTTAPGA